MTETARAQTILHRHTLYSPVLTISDVNFALTFYLILLVSNGQTLQQSFTLQTAGMSSLGKELLLQKLCHCGGDQQ